MSQSCTTPSLFQTSLRQWQAQWKAHHDNDGPSEPAAARRLLRAPKAKRHGGRPRPVAAGARE